MQFTLKSYQILKLKNYFKNKSLFIVFHCAKLNLKEWVQVEQKLKTLQLNYYKPLNKVTLIELKNSKYLNYNSLINGFVLFVSFNGNKFSSDLTQDLQQFQTRLKPLFITLSLKLNDKVYSPQQLNNFKKLSYKENMFKFCRTLNSSLKTSYVLTKIV